MLERLHRLFLTEHQRVQEDLSSYLDGRLNERDRARVERHLDECAACRADLATLRQTIGLLRMVPEIPLPRSFLVPVSEGRTVPRPRPAYALLRTASAVATFLFVLVFSGNMLLRMGVGTAPVAMPQPGVSKGVLRTAPPTVVVEAATAKESPVAEAGRAIMPESALVVKKEAVPASKSARMAEEEAPMVAESPPVPAQVDSQGVEIIEKAATSGLAKAPMPEKELSKSLELPQMSAKSAAKEAAATSVPAEKAPVTAAAESPTMVPASPTPLPEPTPTPIPASPTPLPEVKAGEETRYDSPHQQTVVAEVAQPEWPTSAPRTNVVGWGGGTDRRQMLSETLNSVMWALLLTTVILWAVTAALSKQHR